MTPASPAATGLPAISYLEAATSEVTLVAGDQVSLSVSLHGIQGIRDDSLADDIGLVWDAPDGGSLSGDTSGDSSVLYTAPSAPGTYKVVASVPETDCAADPCTATFLITVRRRYAPPTVLTEEPVNPAGLIPEVVTDETGNQYAVLTPEEGGSFEVDDYSLIAPRGAVQSGEIVGVRMDKAGAASDIGMPHHRYTLAGSIYDISAVDTSGAEVATYRLNTPAEICVPMPPELRPSLSDIALVMIMNDGSLSINSGTARLGPSTSSISVCGKVGTLPASVAVGHRGAPMPTVTPEPTQVDHSELPDSGGAAPRTVGSVVYMMLFSSVILAIGFALIVGRSRRGRT